MQRIRVLFRPVSLFLMTALLALGLHLPAAHAAMVGTDTLLQAQRGDDARARVDAALNREDVRAALLARGVSPEAVQARVDALTAAEAQQLAAQLDSAPAGAGVLELAVFVFLVLLVTDILGYTDIFPFVVKKHAR